MIDPTDPLRNAKDPLHKAGPEASRELFRAMGRLASGFPQEAVLDAALNIVLNSVRQKHGSWQSAERAWDEKMGRTKTVLRDHYDSIGRRRNVFPFDQVVGVPHFDPGAR